jgi:hypothetical protein
METRELTFEQEKETQNTVRYQEQTEDGEAKVIGPLYVQKSALGDKPPQSISVTLWGTEVENELAEESADEEPADEELESVEAGFTDAELGL